MRFARGERATLRLEAPTSAVTDIEYCVPGHLPLQIELALSLSLMPITFSQENLFYKPEHIDGFGKVARNEGFPKSHRGAKWKGLISFDFGIPCMPLRQLPPLPHPGNDVAIKSARPLFCRRARRGARYSLRTHSGERPAPAWLHGTMRTPIGILVVWHKSLHKLGVIT
jgi:hypothetical protein